MNTGKLCAALLVLVAFAAAAAELPRDRRTVAEFKRANPCPANGKTRGACPGWEIDHIQPLCANGPDRADNMQWLSKSAHKEKTKRDVAACRKKSAK